jgi:hypothetical protein
MGTRVAAAIIAGGFAIAVNTIALKAADLVPLATAHGGLLRLLSGWLGPLLQASGIASLWTGIGGPAADTALFQTGFHLAVGIGMALFYAFVLEPALPAGPWLKGAIYAAAVWLLNAAIVLPLTGEGFAGTAHLGVAGIIWFAAAHTVFFLLLAWGYGRLMAARPGSK